jgi:tRNA (guanine6-N2)-methyltransferase
MTSPVPLAAYVTRGLESIAAQEIGDTRRLDAQDITERTKVILFSTPASLSLLQRLRTVDDVCVVAFTDDAAVDIGAFTERVKTVDFEALTQTAGRSDVFDSTFSVTISAARSPLGSATDLEPAVRTAIEQRYGWKGCVDTRGSIDIRVFCDGDWAMVGLRVFDRPLTHRGYRVAHVPGALRPTVAAALVRLGCPDGGQYRVWDPFCGSGTILCEAALAGHKVYGTDISHDAVAATRENLGSLDRSSWGQVELADSTDARTWKRHAQANAVIANLPWGKQVSITSKQKLYDSLSDGVTELLSRGGRAVLLTTETERVRAKLRRLRSASVTESKIGLLGQTPTIFLASHAQ